MFLMLLGHYKCAAVDDDADVSVIEFIQCLRVVQLLGKCAATWTEAEQSSFVNI